MNTLEPHYVTFEQAKYLKEKGFDENCRMLINGAYEPHHLNLTETHLQRNSEILESCYSIPEQHQVVEWLRVNHGIWVYVKLGYGHEFVIQKTLVPFENIYTDGTFKSPQEAYSAAFEYIKSKLIKGGEK
jgi:hypothetical protein